MPEKKFTDRLRVQVPESRMTFNHVDSSLTAEFNQSLLQKHLPPISGVLNGDKTLANSLTGVLPEETIDALNETEFIGVFGRVIRGGPGKLTCLQYLYVYDYQAVPAHEADYEPVFVFLDGSRRYLIYDLVHYCSRELELNALGTKGPGLQMIPGWHSVLPAGDFEVSGADANLEVLPMSDQHLDSWWNIPEEEPRLKIHGYLTNPFLLQAPGHFMDNPDEDAKTVCCVFLEIERAMAEFEDPKEAIIEGIKRAFGRCVGLFALHRLGAFIRLLGEMDQVGMIQISASLDQLGLGTIASFLQDGFVKITTFGSKLLDGFKHSDAVD